MPAKRACLECRAKRVRCVPGVGRCVRCVHMGIENCAYARIQRRGVGKTLKTGEACKYCRIKKKKCDAKRPCTSCVKAKNGPECVYHTKTPKPGQSSRCPSHNTTGHPSGGADPVESPAAVTELQNNLLPSTSDTTRVLTHRSSLLQAPGVEIPHGRLSGLVSVRKTPSKQHLSLDTNSPISIISSFIFSKIPPELRVPLSFLGEENLQVSDAAITDLDMKCRLWALLRYLKFGIQFSHGKLEALLRGDQSGTVVDSFFLYGAHALGMPYCIRIEDTFAMARLLAMRSQLCWERLAEIVKGNDDKLKVQAALIVATTNIYVRLVQSAALYIQKTCDFINAGKMQFVPTYGRPPEFSEGLHETLIALSQTIYWANYLFLMCGGPEPHATSRLEKEFRQELPQTYPVLFEVCPLTMRTQCILLVRDVILLLGILPADSTKLESWRRSCDRTLASLEELSQNLFRKIKSLHERGNTIGTDVVGSSCIACLAHLAVLYEVACRTDPAPKPETYRPCDLALQSLGALTSELYFDEHSYLDLLLGDSWKKSLLVFDVRIENIPSEESRELRDYRTVISEKYSDFQTRVPDCEPPMIVSLSMLEDGTTKDSKYPNLIPAEARLPYGI